eukprot:5774342-Alexandrium_andersonii.AAC.1
MAATWISRLMRTASEIILPICHGRVVPRASALATIVASLENLRAVFFIPRSFKMPLASQWQSAR